MQLISKEINFLKSRADKITSYYYAIKEILILEKPYQDGI